MNGTTLQKSYVPDYFDACSFTYPEMAKAIGYAEESDKTHKYGKVTPENITYMQQVRVFQPNGARLESATVHFFNERGVLVGNIYCFVPYEMLRQHEKGIIRGSWHFKGKGSLGRLKDNIRKWVDFTLMDLTSYLLRITQKTK